MKRPFVFFCVSVYCCFLFPAAAQEAVYTVTETELTELESILMSFQKNRQTQQSQVLSLQDRLKTAHERAHSLRMTLQKAEAQAKDLNSQLQTERTALADLKKSYNTYEAETAAALEAKQTEIEELKETVYRRTIALVVLSALLTVSALFTAFKWYLKGKLRLFPP
ncbi:MAG: hypothetical protein P1P65_00930 [Treponema sp.]